MKQHIFYREPFGRRCARMPMRTYADAGNLDRLYTDEIGILETCDYEPEAAGSYLFGTDVAAITDTATRQRMLNILQDTRLRGGLILDMAAIRTCMRPIENDVLTAVDTVLVRFVAGLSRHHY